VALREAFVASRRTAADAWLRAAPPTAFALLSHMLRNGFFLIQGFFMLETSGMERLLRCLLRGLAA
jgi:hypothetical protein